MIFDSSPKNVKFDYKATNCQYYALQKLNGDVVHENSITINF